MTLVFVEEVRAENVISYLIIKVAITFDRMVSVRSIGVM